MASQTTNYLDRIDKLSVDIANNIFELLKFAENKDDEVRYTALEKLAESRIKRDEIKKTLIDHLEDKSELVRVTCLEILGDWSCNIAEKAVVKCLNDSKSIVRTEAYIALSKFKNKKYIQY